MSFSALEAPLFHIALEGGFYIGTADSTVNVESMDIVMLPDGDMHWMASAKKPECLVRHYSGNLKPGLKFLR